MVCVNNSSESDYEGPAKKFCHWVRITSVLRFIKHIFITNLQSFNIDYKSCPNKKWLNMIQLFDLSQLVTEPTRITETTATTIDHVYSSHPENITECFISHFTISDHFPVCFTRKTNFKVIKNDHLTTSYRCFKKFDDILFLNDLQNDLNSFSANSSDVEEDFSTWHRIIMKHLNNHAPIKTKRVKHKRLPEWYTPEITLTQRLRDNSKRRKQWSEYKHYRNKTRDLIRSAKRKYFSESIINTKDSKFIWKHLRSINSPSTNARWVNYKWPKNNKLRECSCKTKWLFLIHYWYFEREYRWVA